MKEIEVSRKKIGEIDAEMAKLFEARMEVCRDIAAYKKEHGLSVRDTTREAELITKNCALIKDAEIESYYNQFIKNTIKLSCDYQSKLMNGLRVTYCGVEGAYAHIAAKRMFPEAELVSFPDFVSAYEAVQSGEFDCVVLPLENSYAGEVGTVMDLLFSGDLYINQVMDLPIVHNLMGTDNATLDSIKTVVSHPQALQQCGGYIHDHGFNTHAHTNTAMAAQLVKEAGDSSLAAIASDDTAALFNLKILDRGINDSKNNVTRFAALSRSQNRPLSKGKREDENFILVFTVQNEAGALAQTLNIIGAHGFNMRNLRSRPMKDLQWNYYFYIEAEGNINNQNGQDMLHELSAICAKLRLVGTFYVHNLE